MRKKIDAIEKDIDLMTENTLQDFIRRSQPLMDKLGLRYGTKYTTELGVYEHFNMFQYTLCLGICGEKDEVEIRLTLDEDSLGVAWAGNNLLHTNKGDFENEQIASIRIVARIFEHEAEWRDLITGSNIDAIFEEKNKVREERLRELKMLEEKRRAIYDSMNIIKGTKLVNKLGRVVEVKRISANSVQTTDGVFTKETLGQWLEEGDWKVIENP